MIEFKDIKVCIGMATGGLVQTKTLFSVVRMIKNAPFPYEIVTWEGCLVHQNRENIVKEAMKGKCTHLLFVDSDMFFSADAAVQLLEREKDIIGVPTHLRKLPLTSTVHILDENGVTISQKYDDGLWKVAGVGTGFMLIKTAVFEKLSHPWFFFEQDNEGMLTYGEDMWFCRKARQAGFEIWCDTNVDVKHIGNYLY